MSNEASQTIRRQKALDDRGIKWRLNPEETLQEIEDLLKGEKTEEFIDQQNERIVEKNIDIGKELLNKQGRQSVMKNLRARISKTTIQGWTTRDELLNFCWNVHKRLSIDLMENRKEYDLDISDYEGLVDMITDFLYLSLTRTIQNSEREANAKSQEVKETIKEGDSSGWW